MRRALLEALLAARQARRPVAVATELATGEQWLLEPATPAPPGLPVALLDAARARLREDRAGELEIAGRAFFVNVHNPPPRMIVVGAVHIAQALAPMASLAGFAVTLVDPRERFASEARFPGVEIAREWPDTALAALGLDARCAVVTLGHDPKLDDPALCTALRSEAFYVGALGSRRSHAARLARLGRAGFSERELGRIRGPVGLAIGARTHAEIAVSILAEAVGALRGCPKGS